MTQDHSAEFDTQDFLTQSTHTPTAHTYLYEYLSGGQITLLLSGYCVWKHNNLQLSKSS